MSRFKGPIRIKTQRPTRFMPSKDSRTTNKIRIESRASITTSCEFDHTGNYLLSANDRSQINICNVVDTFNKLVYLKYHWEPITEVHYSADGDRIYSASIDRSIVVWDAITCRPMQDLLGHVRGINSVQYSRADANLLCSGSTDRTVRLWDVRNGQNTISYTCFQGLSSTCFSACGKYVFGAGITSGAISTFDIRKKECIHTLIDHKGPVTGLALSPCGTRLASCSADNTIRSWDVTSFANGPKEMQKVNVVQDAPFNLIRCAWSPDGSMLTSGTSERGLYVFNVEDGRILHRLDGHMQIITEVNFHPTKPVLMSAGTDGYLIFHDI